MRVLYLKPPFRHPICVTAPICWGDTQGAIPRAWCQGCGREVFEPGRCFCRACEKEEQKYVRKEESL